MDLQSKDDLLSRNSDIATIAIRNLAQAMLSFNSPDKSIVFKYRHTGIGVLIEGATSVAVSPEGVLSLEGEDIGTLPLNKWVIVILERGLTVTRIYFDGVLQKELHYRKASAPKRHFALPPFFGDELSLSLLDEVEHSWNYVYGPNYGLSETDYRANFSHKLNECLAAKQRSAVYRNKLSAHNLGANLGLPKKKSDGIPKKLKGKRAKLWK